MEGGGGWVAMAGGPQTPDHPPASQCMVICNRMVCKPAQKVELGCLEAKGGPEGGISIEQLVPAAARQRDGGPAHRGYSGMVVSAWGSGPTCWQGWN